MNSQLSTMHSKFGYFDLLPADMRQFLYMSLPTGTRFRIDFCEDPRIIAALHPYRHFAIPRTLSPAGYTAHVFLYMLKGRLQGLLPDLKSYVDWTKNKSIRTPLITRTEVEFLETFDCSVREDPLFTRDDRLRVMANHPFHEIAVEYFLPAKSDHFDFKNGFVRFADVDFDGTFIFVRELNKFYKELTKAVIPQSKQMTRTNAMLTSLILAFVESSGETYFGDDDVSELILSIINDAHHHFQSNLVEYIDSVLWTCQNLCSEQRNKLDVVCRALRQTEHLNWEDSVWIVSNMTDKGKAEFITEEFFLETCTRLMFFIAEIDRQIIIDIHYLLEIIIRHVVMDPEEFPWQDKQEVDDLIYMYNVLIDHSSNPNGCYLTNIVKDVPETVLALIQKYCS